MKSGRRSSNILDQLNPEEAVSVLHHLLEKHPNLRPDIEQMVGTRMSSVCVNEVAEAVFDAVTGIDLDMLNGRAGKHAWGYVEPSEAAQDLLEEAIEDWIEEINRRVKANLVPAAVTVCEGIVVGLYKARNAKGSDVLQWVPDFPAEHAAYVLETFLKSSRHAMSRKDRALFLQSLAAQASEWEGLFSRVGHGGV